MPSVRVKSFYSFGPWTILAADDSRARFTTASNDDSNVEMGSGDARLRLLRDNFRDTVDTNVDAAGGGGGDGFDGRRRVRETACAAKLFGTTGLRNLVMSLGAILVLVLMLVFLSSSKIRHGLTKMQLWGGLTEAGLTTIRGVWVWIGLWLKRKFYI